MTLSSECLSAVLVTELYASSNDNVSRSYSTAAAGLQPEVRYQPAGQCGELSVPWGGTSGMLVAFCVAHNPQQSLCYTATIVIAICVWMCWCWVESFLHICFAAKNGPGSVNTPEGAPRCMDTSGHHPGVLSEHEHQSKLASVQQAFIKTCFLYACMHRRSFFISCPLDNQDVGSSCQRWKQVVSDNLMNGYVQAC